MESLRPSAERVTGSEVSETDEITADPDTERLQPVSMFYYHTETCWVGSTQTWVSTGLTTSWVQFTQHVVTSSS